MKVFRITHGRIGSKWLPKSPQWYPNLVELYADFDSYQSWTDRGMRVVVLER